MAAAGLVVAEEGLDDGRAGFLVAGAAAVLLDVVVGLVEAVLDARGALVVVVVVLVGLGLADGAPGLAPGLLRGARVLAAPTLVASVFLLAVLAPTAAAVAPAAMAVAATAAPATAAASFFVSLGSSKGSTTLTGSSTLGSAS